jgi:pimeloyl-ACP methyl ester carboxylesterase
VIPVVFLHGIGGGARSFAPQMASFASAGYQPVALDLMGYGTREPVEAMSFEALAEDVEFAIGESGLERRCWSAIRWAGWWCRLFCADVRPTIARLCSLARRRPSAIRPATSRRNSWPIA